MDFGQVSMITCSNVFSYVSLWTPFESSQPSLVSSRCVKQAGIEYLPESVSPVPRVELSVVQAKPSVCFWFWIWSSLPLAGIWFPTLESGSLSESLFSLKTEISLFLSRLYPCDFVFRWMWVRHQSLLCCRVRWANRWVPCLGISLILNIAILSYMASAIVHATRYRRAPWSLMSNCAANVTLYSLTCLISRSCQTGRMRFVDFAGNYFEHP